MILDYFQIFFRIFLSLLPKMLPVSSSVCTQSPQSQSLSVGFLDPWNSSWSSRKMFNMYLQRFGTIFHLSYLWSSETIRTYDVVYDTGIMNWWIVKIICLFVHSLIHHKHLVDGFGEWNFFMFFQKMKDCLLCFHLMCEFERNHNKGYILLSLKYLFCGKGIKVDIELSCRSNVPSTNGSSHNHNFLYFLLYLRKLPKHQAKIC